MSKKPTPRARQAQAAEVGGGEQRKALSRMERRGRKAVERKSAKLERLIVEYVPVDKLRPNTWNPNRQTEHDFELLLRSMEEDGFTQPVIALRDSRVIVDGEHRWRAGKQLGLAEIPTVFTDMTEEQARISTLRHNRARGREDAELSAQVLRDLRELGALEWAQDSLMLDDLELGALLEDVPASEALADGEWMPGQDEGAADLAVDDVALTEAAQTDIRERERRIAEAKNEEERQKAVRESKVYRLALIFSGEQATIVKKALGSHAAERLLELCRAAIDADDAKPQEEA